MQTGTGAAMRPDRVQRDLGAAGSRPGQGAAIQRDREWPDRLQQDPRHASMVAALGAAACVPAAKCPHSGGWSTVMAAHMRGGGAAWGGNSCRSSFGCCLRRLPCGPRAPPTRSHRRGSAHPPKPQTLNLRVGSRLRGSAVAARVGASDCTEEGGMCEREAPLGPCTRTQSRSRPRQRGSRIRLHSGTGAVRARGSLRFGRQFDRLFDRLLIGFLLCCLTGWLTQLFDRRVWGIGLMQATGGAHVHAVTSGFGLCQTASASIFRLKLAPPSCAPSTSARPHPQASFASSFLPLRPSTWLLPSPRAWRHTLVRSLPLVASVCLRTSVRAAASTCFLVGRRGLARGRGFESP